MKYIFILLTLLFSPNLSLREIKPKLCINCKYFITDNISDKYGKCSLFTILDTNRYDLVDGIRKDKNILHHYCSTSRSCNHMCSEEGKMYKKKYTRK
jgi:hypothetical protein